MCKQFIWKCYWHFIHSSLFKIDAYCEGRDNEKGLGHNMQTAKVELIAIIHISANNN